MGAMAGASDWQLLRADGLLRHRQRKLHHGAFSGVVRSRLLVYGVDVIVAGPILRFDPECGDPYQAVSSGRVGGIALQMSVPQGARTICSAPTSTLNFFLFL